MEDRDLDEARIDLSALDVHADELHVERTVRRLTAAVLEARGSPLLTDLARRGRLALAAAAALAVAAWAPALATTWGRGPAAATTAQDPVLLVTEWAQAGAIPADASLFHLAGGADAR